MFCNLRWCSTYFEHFAYPMQLNKINKILQRLFTMRLFSTVIDHTVDMVLLNENLSDCIVLFLLFSDTALSPGSR